MNEPNNKHGKLVAKLMVAVVTMFGFGFALVPLYDVFCDITGINGKTNNSAAKYIDIEVDQSRTVSVEFITRTHNGMPWRFDVMTQRVELHPGEMKQVDFYAKNPTMELVTGHAVPSVSPGKAASYLQKTECFCFINQPLASGDDMTMPVVFFLDPSLPDDISFLTVQYTMYKVSNQESQIAMNNE
jgi:cytochrome c oxidase assembly protein subunit 11